jgi:hypothetical protein
MAEKYVVLTIDTSDIRVLKHPMIVLKVRVNLSNDFTDLWPHSSLISQHDILKIIVHKSFEHRDI